jgi:hypothetical protein
MDAASVRALSIAAMLLLPNIEVAVAQVVVPPPPNPRETRAAEKAAYEAAVADCIRIWDSGTHMTKQQWARTCRRVQDRIQQLQLK